MWLRFALAVTFANASAHDVIATAMDAIAWADTSLLDANMLCSFVDTGYHIPSFWLDKSLFAF